MALMTGGAVPAPAPADPVESMRQNLLEEVRKLETRVEDALEKNRASMIIRYIFLTLLALVVVGAIIVAIATQQVTFAVLGSVVPIPLTGYLLTQFRGLQDERIQLIMLLGRYPPVIVICTDIKCLQEAGTRLYIDLARFPPP